MPKNTQSSATKSRNWTVIVYPESAPENWMTILDDLHVRALVSPLHDMDVDRDGTPKKPHWHVMVMFDGPKTLRAAKEALGSLGGTAPQMVASVEGTARYLCHLDNEEKAKYSIADVKQFGGVDYFELIETHSDRTQVIGEMQDWCDANGVTSYAELNRYARRYKRDWFRVLSTSATLTMKEYLRSLKWEIDQNMPQGWTVPDSESE